MFLIKFYGERKFLKLTKIMFALSVLWFRKSRKFLRRQIFLDSRYSIPRGERKEIPNLTSLDSHILVTLGDENLPI